MKVVRMINLVLIVLWLVLLINLISPFFSITGNVAYAPWESQCTFYNQGQTQEIPLKFCCLQLQGQLNCRETNSTHRECSVAKNSPYFYVINEVTYHYCQEEGYQIR